MTEEAKKEVIDYLKSLHSGQKVTIEEIVRFLGKKNGEPFSIFEVQIYEEIENQLLKEGLIADTGKSTKLYAIGGKLNTF